MSATWRWRTSGVPSSGGRPLTAFMPILTFTEETWQSFKAYLTGAPGTDAIPAPNNGIPRDRLAIGEGQAYARDFGGHWFPDIWWQDVRPALQLGNLYPAGGSDCGVQIYSDNQLPVPSIDPTRGTYRYGGGQVVPAYQDTFRRAQTKRRVSPYNG